MSSFRARSGLRYRLDVTDRDSFANFLDAVERDIGQLDVLVNNAGIMPLGRFLDEDEALARRQVEINLHGVALGMRLALPRLIGRRDGTWSTSRRVRARPAARARRPTARRSSPSSA
jgi:NAD(P)-dependent dehydrogenase (short-subunit alcohol dehydrogenase family)